MEVFYINHKNKKLDLGRPPFQLQIGDLFDYSYKYEGKNGVVNRIYKDITTMRSAVTISESSEEGFFDSVNRFFEVVETDTAAGVQGRLYIGDYYLSCNIIASDKSFWREVFQGVENTVKLLVANPSWYRELTKSFLKGNPITSQDVEEYLYYPFGYPYQYSMPRDVGFVENDHYAACDFRMIVYGPCVNPAVLVNGHLYEVTVTLYQGEYLEIDSRNNTALQHLTDGRTENLFNWRNKESGLFEKVPAGRCAVVWNAAAFGFDLTLFQERSEPKWTL